jgi:hypothetical protein
VARPRRSGGAGRDGVLPQLEIIVVEGTTTVTIMVAKDFEATREGTTYVTTAVGSPPTA